MKIFLDTANLDHIKKWSKTGLIDGITTNPSSISREGNEPKELILEICKVMENKDVSVEVTEKEPEKVYSQAKEIAKLANNVVVKIPCHADYFETIKKLVKEEIKINITLVFSPLQGLMMAKLGVKYISPFIGRLYDIDIDGIVVIEEIRQLLDAYEYNSTEILAASIRTVRDFNNSILSGADVVTLPVEVFEKSINHPLTDQGIKKFDSDWQKLGIRKFP